MPRSETPWGITNNCENIDCVIDKYDDVVTNNPIHGGKVFKYREGYKDTPIRYMYDHGYITIEPQPLWARLFIISTGSIVPGAAVIKSGENGDVGGCEVYYEPVFKFFSYDWIVHEFEHCQGYTESGLSPTGMFAGDFTNGQKRILVKEFGKDWEEKGFHWVDTEHYKNEDSKWHDPTFKK